MTAEPSTTKTTDYGDSRRWVAERGGKPARVRGTGDIDAGVLRIAFGDDEKLEAIDWDECS